MSGSSDTERTVGRFVLGGLAAALIGVAAKLWDMNTQIARNEAALGAAKDVDASQDARLSSLSGRMTQWETIVHDQGTLLARVDERTKKQISLITLPP